MLFMSRSKSIVLSVAFLLLVATSLGSCSGCSRQVAKLVGREFAEEGGEKLAKESLESLFEEVGEKGLKQLDFATLGKLDYEQFGQILKRGNINAYKQFDALGSPVQKGLLDEMKRNPLLFDCFTREQGFLLKYKAFCQGAEAYAESPKLMSYYANILKDHATRYRHADIAVKGLDEGALLFNKKTGRELGSYSRGVLTLPEDALSKGKLLDAESIIHGRLMPDCLYKLGDNALSCRYKTNSFGQVQEAIIAPRNLKGGDILDLYPNAVNLPKQDLDRLNKEIAKLGEGVKGPMEVKINSRYKSGDEVAPQTLSIELKQGGKRIYKETLENTFAKLPISEQKMLKELKARLPHLRPYVTETAEGRLYRIEGFGSSEMLVKPNGDIIAKAGSTMKNGQHNEFLNFYMPDRTYRIDDGAFVIKTDRLGRVSEATADRNKAYNLLDPRNPQRDSKTQAEIVRLMDGRYDSSGKSLDDGGHIFANNTNGGNERIFQVPMDARSNRRGEWRSIERQEEQALREGKTLISNRKFHYKGDSFRPDKIEVSNVVDNERFDFLVDNLPSP